MAVPVDRVYQTVLTLLNKEQRGFLPQKEFNQLAQQAQVEIFENYFFELGRATAQYGEMTDEYASIADNIFEKLEDFETTNEPTVAADGTFTLPSDLYRLQTITSNYIEVMRKKHREIGYMLRSPLTAPNPAMPCYTRTGNEITLFPNTTTVEFTEDQTTNDALTAVVVNYIRNLRTEPEWIGAVLNGQVVVSNSSVDFELHPSEEPELVAKILGYAGLVVKAQDVIQSAGALSAAITQQEQ